MSSTRDPRPELDVNELGVPLPKPPPRWLVPNAPASGEPIGTPSDQMDLMSCKSDGAGKPEQHGECRQAKGDHAVVQAREEAHRQAKVGDGEQGPERVEDHEVDLIGTASPRAVAVAKVSNPASQR